MSSFICSPKHFNSIEWNLRQLIINHNDFTFPYNLRKKFKVLGSASAEREDREKELTAVMNELRRLNATCVSLQYAHNTDGHTDKEIAQQTDYLINNRVNIKPQILTARELYNALRCVNYQIEIGHLQELRDLTSDEALTLLFMEEMINSLAHHIIYQLPDNAGVRWCID